MSTQLPTKDYQEVLPIQFNFTADLGAETISSASVAVSVAIGADAAPSSLLQGSATIASGVVTQWIKAGVAGVVYHLRCKIVTSGSRTLVLAAQIPVGA